VSEVGRLFLEALRFDRESLEALEGRAERALELGVGGFILFGGEADRVAAMVARLRAAADRNLWIAADLERGPGQQFAGTPTLPPPAALSAHPDAEEATRHAGALTGRVARQLGINWALAPVLDLDVEPDNPIVATRSFGSNPKRVGRLGAVWIDACQAEGTAACAKHFPGHGRTVTDSHIGLPRIEASRDELLAELEPYRAVLDRVAAIMTAHVAFPALGGDGPATLEPAILRDLLRDSMGFPGLVVTDALIMGGFGATEESEGALMVRAVRAGCDVLLYPQDLAASIRAVEDAVREDDALARRVRDSVARSEAVCSAHSGRALESGRPRDLESTDGKAAVAEESIVLATGCVRGDPEPARRALDRDAPVAVRLVSDDRRPPGLPPLGEAFRAELMRLGWSVAAADRGSGQPPGQRIVLLEATPQGWKGRAGLSRQALETVQTELAAAREAEQGVYLIVLGHARLLDSLPGPAACAWAAEPVMESAAARWIDGAIP